MTAPTPAFQIADASAAVKALLGSAPLRLWPFGLAPQKGKPGYTVPYAVQQVVYGTPQNTLSCPPDIDNFGVQFDVYAANASAAWQIAYALRDAYQGSYNQVTAWNLEGVDEETGLYRVSFTVDFWPSRNQS